VDSYLRIGSVLLVQVNSKNSEIIYGDLIVYPFIAVSVCYLTVV